MKKKEMIKSQKEFSNIIHNSPYIKNKDLILYITNSKYEYSHFGIAVSKKLGNAVLRNKLKRRMRCIIDKYR